jgi:hypothetical protein
VPYLDALATVSADGRAVTVLLVNKHPAAALAVRLALGGASGAEGLSRATLAGHAPDANTGTELPRIPGLAWGTQARFGRDGRFAEGGEGEVTVERAALGAAGAETLVRLPPHSVSVLRFDGVGRR